MTALKTKRNTHKNQLEKELVILFGKETFEQSKLITEANMKAVVEQVSEGVKQLAAHKDNPKEQRQIIKGMSNDTATALCKWILGAE